MARKRLTTATLQDRQRHASSEKAADLAFKLLGPAASDRELIKAGAMLHQSLGVKKLANLHGQASRIAQETGEDFPGPDENEGPPQPNPSVSQDYSEEHVTSPDHVVLDTVVNRGSPTVDPTASRKAADEEDTPDLEDPDDVEGGDDEDHVDSYDDSEDMDDMEDEDMEDPEEDYDEDEDVGDEDEPGLDDFMDDGDSASDGGSTSSDQGGSEEYYDDYSEDRDFDQADAEALKDLGMEDIPGVTSSRKKARNGSRAASKKNQFRPSRTRTASSAAGRGDEFESVFGTPDLGDMFLH